MKKSLFAPLFLCILAISCKKSDTSSSTPDPYFSMTAGNSWNYELVNSSTLPATTTPYTLTSTSRDTTIGTRSYHIFTNSAGNTSEYYNISGNDYYQYQNFAAALSTAVENLYLKDNAPAGTAWNQSFNITVPGLGSVPITVTNTISEKGITKVVKGTSYSDVIHVVTTITPPLGVPASAITTSINFYYARRFGQIANHILIDINAMGVTQHIDTETNLVSAIIH